MTEVSLTFGGLVALVVSQDRARAAAALVQHGQHRHVPLLVVPTEAIGDLTGIADDLRVADLGPYLAQTTITGPERYTGFSLDGVNVELVGPHAETAITEHDVALPASGCPEGNDWSSVRWLLDLNEANQTEAFTFDEGRVSSSALVPCVVPMSVGMLRGHAPIELVRRIALFEYPGLATRAFTDAFTWRVTVNGAVRLGLTRRSGGTGDVGITGTLQAYILNLPDPLRGHRVPPGGHIEAFANLPFNPPITIGTVSVAGQCGVPDAQASDATPLGDGHCMGSRVIVTTF